MSIADQPAFPIVNHGESVRCGQEGLTKREYFAALVAAGKSANSIPGSHHQPKTIAAEAVEIADALLAELAKECA